MPQNVSLNKVANDYFNKIGLISEIEDKIDEECFHDTSEVINNECDKSSIRNGFLQKENELQQKIVLHFEIRIKDQEVTINLLDKTTLENNKELIASSILKKSSAINPRMTTEYDNIELTNNINRNNAGSSASPEMPLQRAPTKLFRTKRP